MTGILALVDREYLDPFSVLGVPSIMGPQHWFLGKHHTYTHRPSLILALAKTRGAAICTGFSVAAVACLGCQGDLKSSDPPQDGETIGESPGGVDISCDAKLSLSESPLLKLTTAQYQNTVRDLLTRTDMSGALATVSAALASIPDDSLGEGFRSLDDRVALEHVQGFFNVSAAVGDYAMSSGEILTALVGTCVEQPTLSEACFHDFQDSFLRLVHRRPLLSSERDAYDALNDGTRSPGEVIRAAIVVGLSSPRFVYHVEVDGEALNQEADLLALDAFEIASRLSYTFWRTMPDDELLSLAEDGSLLEEDVYQAQLLRVWEDERTKENLNQFWIEWLKLEKFTGFETTRPGFQALAQGENVGQPGHDYYGDMVSEVSSLVALFTFESPGPLRDLLTTNLSVTKSADLAKLYGVEPWDGSGPYPALPAGERAGLLQRGALLVSNLEHTNPFHRGALIRRNILCDPLPQPDPNSLPPGSLDPPPFDEAATTRERFAAKVEGNGLCEKCHQSFSNIGYVMENFDALGRFRTVEKVFDEQTGALLAELDIDTVAEARIGNAAEAPVENASDLNQRIVESGKVEACLAENYFSYVARRIAKNSSYDKCVIQDLTQTLSQSDGGLSEAFQRMARVSTFFNRKVGAK